MNRSTEEQEPKVFHPRPWEEKGGRLSTKRICRDLRKARDGRDLVRLLRAHEEIMMHMQGRPRDRKKLIEAVDDDNVLWLYMASRGWLPDGPAGQFKRGVRS